VRKRIVAGTFYLMVVCTFIFSEDAALPSENAAGSETYADDSSESGDGSLTVLPHLYTYVDSPVAEQRSVFTRADIEKLHVESVPALIASTGTQLLSYGAYGMQSAPSIRGFTGSTVRVVIDGVCVNSQQNGTFDFTSLNIDDIEKIEIVRGGFTEDSSGEGAVGGVIYITTKKQSLSQQFSVDAFTKTYFNASFPFDTEGVALSFNGRTGENSFLRTNVKGTFAENTFPYVAYDDSTRYRKDSNVVDGSGDIQFTHFFDYGNSWYVGNNTYAGYKNSAGTETATTPGVQQDCNNRLSAGVTFPAIAKCIKSETNIMWQSNNQQYDAAPEASKHYLNTVSLVSTASYFGSKKINLMLGTSLNLAYLDSTNDGSHLLAYGFVKSTTKLFFTDVFSCSLPVALSFSGDNVAVVPKLGLRADCNKVSFILDGYRMCLFPDMNQLYWTESQYASGNKDLLPEDGWGGEVSCSVKQVLVPFSVCVFSNYYFNKIQWQNVNGRWQPVNVASAFYLGCDVSMQTVLFSCLTLKANGEYLYNKLLAEGITYGKRIMYTPEVTGSVSVTYENNFLTAIVDAQYVGLRYVSNLNASYLAPYLLLNLSASFHAGKYITPYLRVDNILNADYESIPDYPMPGISLMVGVKAKW